jgi:hypothetical protein
VDVLENTSSLEHKTKIPIEQLPNQLLQKQRHLESIEKKMQEIKFKKQLLLIDYNITADSLQEFKTNRPSF